MKNKNNILLLLITALLLVVAALYNGFGLTESDTGAYIEKGILNIIPNDRSPFYGWFIRYTSMWNSLWFTLFAQSLILSYLLLKYIQLITGNNFLYQASDIIEAPSGMAFRYNLSTVVMIVSFTCVNWVAGYLMPDIFAAILLLASLLYLASRKETVAQHIVYCIIIYLAIIVHNSHFLILFLFSLLLTVWALIKKRRPVLRRSIILLLLSVSGWLTLCWTNQGNGYGFTVSRGSNIFMITKFAETGILKTYLDENCDKKNLKLCPYKNQIPDYSWDFLWDKSSPLYLTGGWDSNKMEYNMIIHDVFTTPKYLKMFVLKSATSTMRQLFQVQAPDNTTFQGKWSSPWQRVGTYFEDEQNEYSEAKQSHEGISATAWNYVYYIFFVLSSVWVLFYRKKLGDDLLFFYGCIFLFLVVNAFVTATGSTVVYRFQNRVFWILPATNAILLTRYYWSKFQPADKAIRTN